MYHNLEKQHGLTQQELADKSYVTIRTVQRLEAGEDVSSSSLSAIKQMRYLSL